eukprot:850342-Prorocentrum_minimum.AAC.1
MHQDWYQRLACHWMRERPPGSGACPLLPLLARGRPVRRNRGHHITIHRTGLYDRFAARNDGFRENGERARRCRPHLPAREMGRSLMDTLRPFDDLPDPPDLPGGVCPGASKELRLDCMRAPPLRLRPPAAEPLGDGSGPVVSSRDVASGAFAGGGGALTSRALSERVVLNGVVAGN